MIEPINEALTQFLDQTYIAMDNILAVAVITVVGVVVAKAVWIIWKT